MYFVNIVLVKGFKAQDHSNTSIRFWPYKMLDINSSGSACTTGSIIPFLVKSKMSLLITSFNLENFIGDGTKAWLGLSVNST